MKIWTVRWKCLAQEHDTMTMLLLKTKSLYLEFVLLSHPTISTIALQYLLVKGNTAILLWTLFGICTVYFWYSVVYLCTTRGYFFTCYEKSCKICNYIWLQLWLLFISQDKLLHPYNLEKIIDDWILMGFLVGNDFIPHLPNLHINHVSWEFHT